MDGSYRIGEPPSLQHSASIGTGADLVPSAGGFEAPELTNGLPAPVLKGALGSHGPDWTQYSLQTSTEAGLLTPPG